jgi:hypothetical protein
MNNKIIVWCGLIIAASLWFVYALGFHNGIKEGWAQAQLNGQYVIGEEGLTQPRVDGHYTIGEVSWTRSLNYQAEPFPPPKPMRLPPLAPTPTHAVEYE